MQTITIALFGEAEKGEYHTAYYLRTLPELVENLGNPPPDTSGLFCAVQVLLYQSSLLFFRVREEGFSYQDYLDGLHLLQDQWTISPISALYLPGVGDAAIIEVMLNYCRRHHSIMITRENDFYDYLTCRSNQN